MSKVYLDEHIVASLISQRQKLLQAIEGIDAILDTAGVGQQINIKPVKSSGASIKSQIRTPPITKTEKKKYANEYPRKDIIEFTNVEIGVRRYRVLVNGKEALVEYANLVLLLYFAMALKQEKDLGWVSYDKVSPDTVPEYRSERIVRNRTHFHRVIGELKMQINPLLEPNINISIIDNKVRKSKYRLTTMPSRIDTRLNWLRKKYKEIKKEVIKERQKGEERREWEDQRKKNAWLEEDRQKRKKRQNSSHNTDGGVDCISHPEAYDVLKQAKRDAR